MSPAGCRHRRIGPLSAIAAARGWIATSRMKGLQPGSDFPGDALEIPEAQACTTEGLRVLHVEKERFRLDVSFGTAPRGKVQPFSRINPAPIKASRLRLSDTVHHECRPTAVQQHRRRQGTPTRCVSAVHSPHAAITLLAIYRCDRPPRPRSSWTGRRWPFSRCSARRVIGTASSSGFSIGGLSSL